MSKEQRKTEERPKFEVLIISKGERIPYAVDRIESENWFEKRGKIFGQLVVKLN